MNRHTQDMVKNRYFHLYITLLYKSAYPVPLKSKLGIDFLAVVELAYNKLTNYENITHKILPYDKNRKNKEEKGKNNQGKHDMQKSFTCMERRTVIWKKVLFCVISIVYYGVTENQNQKINHKFYLIMSV